VGFPTEKGLRIHYGKSLHCGAHAAACQAYMKRNNIVRPHSSPNQPWDFGNDDATSVACFANSRVLPTFNNDTVDVKTDVDEDNSSQNTYQFGIKYTTAQFTETKLFKILNDAAVPHFLYHDILSWASEAKRNQYSFCPKRLEQSSQVKYLEKWLHLAPCRPETVKLVLPGPAKEAIQVTRFNLYLPTNKCMPYYLIPR
jgi:hypothetical protein